MYVIPSRGAYSLGSSAQLVIWCHPLWEGIIGDAPRVLDYLAVAWLSISKVSCCPIRCTFQPLQTETVSGSL